MLGGDVGGVTKLLAILTSLDFTTEQVTAFLPKIMEILKKFLPADLRGKLVSLGLGQADES